MTNQKKLRLRRARGKSRLPKFHSRPLPLFAARLGHLASTRPQKIGTEPLASTRPKSSPAARATWAPLKLSSELNGRVLKSTVTRQTARSKLCQKIAKTCPKLPRGTAAKKGGRIFTFTRKLMVKSAIEKVVDTPFL